MQDINKKMTPYIPFYILTVCLSADSKIPLTLMLKFTFSGPPSVEIDGNANNDN